MLMMFLPQIQAFSTQISTALNAQFIGQARIMLGCFLIVKLAFLGMEIAEAAPHLRMSLLVRVGIRCALASYLLIGYHQWTGQVVADTGHVAAAISGKVDEKLFSILDELVGKLGVPLNPFNVLAVVFWFLIGGVTVVASAIILVILSVTVIAQSAIVGVGPLFVPFLLGDEFGMENYFFSWLHAFFQYCFQWIVASCFLFAFGSLLINTAQHLVAMAQGGLLLTNLQQNAAGIFGGLLGMVPCAIAFLYVPSVTRDIFGGTSSASGSGGVTGAASKATSVVFSAAAAA